MSQSDHKTLYSLALEMLKSTSPYTCQPEEHLYLADGETVNLCSMVKKNLSRMKYETGRANSNVNNCRKCIEAIEGAMIDYVEDLTGAYSVVQHHKNKFGQWIKQIAEQYGQGMDFEIPAELQYDNEYQSTAVVLLKELQNRDGVTKKDLQNRLGLKPRQIAKDLRKLDNLLIENGEPADMSDYVPFRIGGQPVQVKIKAERNPVNPGDRNMYYKTVNSLHPIVLQENLMQAGTLIQALCNNYLENNNNISLGIAADIWYQLSEYARSRIKLIYSTNEDVTGFISEIEDSHPAGDKDLYMTEREMIRNWDVSNDDMLMYFLKVPDRHCNIVIRDEAGNERKLYDQSISAEQNAGGQIIYTASGKDGNIINFSILDFIAIEEAGK